MEGGLSFDFMVLEILFAHFERFSDPPYSEVLKEISLIDSVFAIYNSTKPNNENLKLNNVEFYKLDVTSEQEIFKFIKLNKNRFKKLLNSTKVQN